jgi:hypothetical protein
MGADPVSTAAVDYLQRVQMVPALRGGGATAAPLAARRLVRVVAVGQPTRAVPPLPAEGVAFEPPTLPLLVGLAGAGTPVAFLLEGHGQGVSVRLGTWAGDGTGDAALDAGQAMLLAVLEGSYPVVDIAAAGVATPRLGCGAFGLGVPSPAVVDPRDGALPIDRLVRSMTGLRWAALVLAAPVGADWLSADRNGVLNEMRAAATAVQATGLRSPLGEHYLELLQARLEALAGAQARGGWRTAVYLLGPGPTEAAALASAWRAVFSGAKSVPEPVRTVAHPAVADLAAHWALPDDPERPGPGSYRHPFAAQTLLSSVQLAAYVHLPALETPGFGVRIVPRFDTVAAADAADAGLAVGRITRHRRDTGADYRISLRSLTRHVFVSGVTGSGKTNTIFSLLAAADAAGVPFLVIEPAKTEYRALIDHPVLGGRVRVFTAGHATVAPLLLNPFEVPPGTTVSEHLDLVRTAFAAAFGMWTPLPQILERCLHEVYADRGWDLATNTNIRLAEGDDPADAYPTLADLVAKAAEVIPTLGYEEKVTGDLRAALTTRLESLRSGGKGAMLDVARSLPIADLLAGPTVVELEAMGDEGDKAFLAALIVIRLAEHRRSQGQTADLVHLLVIEEAHRLLANVPAQVSAEVANPRGQAVETFANLLSEIRAYGQGVVVADQVPVRLAPDVMKNTNLKIAHRTVSADDRGALGGAMAMEQDQTTALTTLAVGEAAVFSTGDDSPLLIRVPLAKDPMSPNPPADERVAAHMARWRATEQVQALFLPRPFCADTCTTAPEECATARRLMADEYVQRTVARTVLATIEQPGALDRLWDDLLGVIRARRPARLGQNKLMRAVAGHAADWYAQRRGAQGVWTYADTSKLGAQLRTVLLDKLHGGSAHTTTELRAVFQATARALHVRDFSPYPVCEHVCNQNPPLCLYRSAVADLVATRRYQPSWRAADTADATSPDNRRQQTWEVCQDAAYEIAEFPEPGGPAEVNDQINATARRVCLCFQQQMLADDHRKVPRTTRRVLARVLTEAGL